LEKPENEDAYVTNDYAFEPLYDRQQGPVKDSLIEVNGVPMKFQRTLSRNASRRNSTVTSAAAAAPESGAPN
jgi:hypothetical protein